MYVFCPNPDWSKHWNTAFLLVTGHYEEDTWILSICLNKFLSSAYVVSPGPTSRNYFFFFLSFFHSVSNFLGASLVKDLASGSGSGIPIIQDIEPSNSRAWLSHATLRFCSLAEQCHTKKFSGVSSKFGLLLE